MPLFTGIKNQLTWPQYSIIAGPTAAAPKDVNLTQIKFSGNGLELLDAASKKIVIAGPKVKDTRMVLNWNLAARKPIYSKYFLGRKTVGL